MAERFMQTMLTPSVQAAEERYYGHGFATDSAPPRDPLTDAEREFIEARDSFYMASITESGWPYIQHRGGERGFLHVVNPAQLAFADYKGNRQLLSTGNVSANDRVALFLMDYPNRQRLKILGHAHVEDAREHPGLVAQFAGTKTRSIVERIFIINVLSYDWNCPKYITPRFDATEIEQVVAPLKRRIAELEAQLKARPI